MDKKSSHRYRPRNRVPVILKLIETFLNNGARVALTVLLFVRRGCFAVFVCAAGKEFEARQPFKQAMRGDRRPQERDDNTQHYS